MEDNIAKINSEWLRCPVCENKTRLQIRGDTEPKNFSPILSERYATERCTHANDRYLYMITRHPIIKIAAIS